MEEEGTELSTDEELEGGGTVTVDEDPEDEEEVDLGKETAAAAGLAGTSEASVPTGLSGALDPWLEAPAVAAGIFGRTAVPRIKINRCLQCLREKRVN